MSLLMVFLAAMTGSMVGVLVTVLPVLYIVKRKFSKSPMGQMF